MANAIITMKIMPESPEVDLKGIEEKAKEIIVNAVGEGEMKVEIEPIAFGLKAINIIFVMDENIKLDSIEEKTGEIEGVNSVEITDVRRAIG